MEHTLLPAFLPHCRGESRTSLSFCRSLCFVNKRLTSSSPLLPSLSSFLLAPRRPPRGKAEPCRCGRPSSYAACGQKTESQQGGREERDSFSQRIRYHKGNWSRECLFLSVHCARACALMILCAYSSFPAAWRALLPSFATQHSRSMSYGARLIDPLSLSAQSASLLLAGADFVIAFSRST